MEALWIQETIRKKQKDQVSSNNAEYGSVSASLAAGLDAVPQNTISSGDQTARGAVPASGINAAEERNQQITEITNILSKYGCNQKLVDKYMPIVKGYDKDALVDTYQAIKDCDKPIKEGVNQEPVNKRRKDVLTFLIKTEIDRVYGPEITPNAVKRRKLL